MAEQKAKAEKKLEEAKDSDDKSKEAFAQMDKLSGMKEVAKLVLPDEQYRDKMKAMSGIIDANLADWHREYMQAYPEHEEIFSYIQK